MPALPLAHSAEDADLAHAVANRLPVGTLALCGVDRAHAAIELAGQLATVPGPVILLLTPRFLRNPNCLSGLLPLLRGGRPFFVCTDEVDLTQRPQRQQYLSHWQERYIDLRRGLDTETEADQQAFQQYLEKVREISIAIGDLLAELTELPSTRYNDSSLESLRAFVASDGTTPGSGPAVPATADAQLAAAWELYDDGEFAKALDTLSAATALDSEDTSVRYQYALMLAMTGNAPGQARSEIDELLDDDPYHPDGLYLSGELHAASGDVAAARNDWERLYEITTDYPQLAHRLGRLLADHSDELEQAAELLQEADQREELSVTSRFALAKVFLRSDRSDAAREQLLSCLADDSAFAPAYYELATLAYADGRREEAAEHYQRAARLEPAYATPANVAAFAAPTATTRPPLPATAPQPSGEEDLPALTVLITGATSGIGQATAARLVRAGYRVILTGRRADRLQASVASLRALNLGEVTQLELDVTDRRASAQLLDGLPEGWRNIDVLINNAGKAKGFDPIHEGRLDHWDEMIDVNLRGLLYITRAVTPHMVRRGSGMVINVASTAGKEVYPNGNVYCATKHAVDALTYAMRLDLVKHGIRVGQICPAHVEETEFAVVRFDGDRERAKIYEDFQPLRSSDVAEAIYFMLSQPPHVNIMDMVLQGTQQASSTVVDRSGRERFAPTQTSAK